MLHQNSYYVIGNDFSSIYLYRFDLNLKLIEKIKISDKLYYTSIEQFKDSFLLKGTWRSHDKAYLLDYQGNKLDSLNVVNPGNFSNVFSENQKIKIEFLDDENDKVVLISNKSSEILSKSIIDFSYFNNCYHKISEKRYIIAGQGKISPKWVSTSFGFIMLLSNTNHNIQLFNDNTYTKVLESTYSTQDSFKLEILFNDWHQMNVEQTDYNNEEWFEETYNIYKQLYPELLNPTRKTDGNLLYNPKYHLINNSIQVEISDSINVPTEIKQPRLDIRKLLYKPGIKREITDFRPNVTIDRKVIYCDQQIRESLLIFLSNYNGDQEELNKRISFLKSKLRIIPAHWVGAPNIYSLPDIKRIIFNSDYSKSIVEYRNEGPTFYRVYYEKFNEKWIHKRMIVSIIS